MRKHVMAPLQNPATEAAGWLNLEPVARVEVTSEDPAFPIEQALLPGGRDGWRAGGPGTQAILVEFDRPLPLRKVHLVIEETSAERTQELVLRARGVAGEWRDLVRQQFNFSPGGATRETEDYAFDMGEVAALELTVTPDIGGGNAHASLKEFRVR